MNHRCRYTYSLSPAELAVVRAILAGHTTYVEIATALICARRTVQSHLYHILQKTGATNMTALVLMALRLKPCPIDLAGQLQEEPCLATFLHTSAAAHPTPPPSPN